MAMRLSKSPSILRNLFISFLAFGLGMGVIFPFYAQFFVEWKPGMFIWFSLGCLIAGAVQEAVFLPKESSQPAFKFVDWSERFC